ncbi:MAG TPA: OsmC family protein [Gaiellaceae bacterium]|jgi:organic hydroperoxide reductase OsmC/OhrA|nr:OsmC family protein [Gaiellaceae bacterium]
MAAVRAKSFTYEVVVDSAGRLSAEDEGTFVEVGDEWTPDHLLLASVVRCSLASLAFHARRADLDCTASGTARGTVTKPDDEERYRFVEIDAQLEVELDPALDGEPLAELLARAERDCFVGWSLVSKPTYAWRVNGRDV